MREIVELAARIAELERRFAGTIRHGTVAEVDPASGRARLDLGESTEGGRFLSPWVPYSQIAGALKAHVPPSVGQQLTLVAPGGDWQQAVAVPLGFSEKNPSPSSAGDRNVITYGNVTLTLADDLVRAEIGSLAFEITSAKVRITVGGVTFMVSGGGVEITGGAVRHDGRNIGSTHIHGGVTPGEGKTDLPEH
jgi:phage baseplate assembly protein V